MFILSNTKPYTGNGVQRENLACHMGHSEPGANQMPGRLAPRKGKAWQLRPGNTRSLPILEDRRGWEERMDADYNLRGILPLKES